MKSILSIMFLLTVIMVSGQGLRVKADISMIQLESQEIDTFQYRFFQVGSSFQQSIGELELWQASVKIGLHGHQSPVPSEFILLQGSDRTANIFGCYIGIGFGGTPFKRGFIRPKIGIEGKVIIPTSILNFRSQPLDVNNLFTVGTSFSFEIHSKPAGCRNRAYSWPRGEFGIKAGLLRRNPAPYLNQTPLPSLPYRRQFTEAFASINLNSTKFF